MTTTDAPIWQLRDSERIIVGNAALLAQQHFLIGITRVRNEALILRDSLDFVGQHVDAIVAYDDASTDQTLDVFRSHPKVVLILANGSWEADVKARKMAEHRHRQLLLQTARARLQFDWMFCFDPDERVTGNLRGFAGGNAPSCDAARGRLRRRCVALGADPIEKLDFRGGPDGASRLLSRSPRVSPRAMSPAG